MAQGYRVKLAIGLTDFKTRGLAGLNFIEDAVIDMLESGIHNFREPVAILADHIDAGLDSSRLGCGQKARGLGSISRIQLVQSIQQEQIPEVKNPRPGSFEIQVQPAPK